jgi:hypothetical protein
MAAPKPRVPAAWGYTVFLQRRLIPRPSLHDKRQWEPL